jgi:type II secretory ATPase GspE/PulE/Tfp pilus assembly ATPase PilB-like protein
MMHWNLILAQQLPERGGYVSPVKLVVIFVVFLVWLHFCQWTNRDTRYLKFALKEVWNGVVLCGGILGTLAWLFLPWAGGLFAVGGLVWFLLAGGAGIVYVVYRNSVVVESARVFTPAHISRLIAGMGKSKGEKMQATEKVKLKASDGKQVAVPETLEEIEAYQIAQDFLFDALWRRATEVNLAIQGEQGRLAYRIDGAVIECPPYPLEKAEKLLMFMRKIAGQDPEERRRPQVGKIQALIPGAGGKAKMEISIRTEGSTAGERLYLRVTSDEAKLRLTEIGLSPVQLKRVEALLGEPKGLVIFSAPKRNGLTTTMYAALRSHDAFIQHLHTLEKSPLMDLENVTQNLFRGEGPTASYAQQLGTILRREPDVVMVEVCDDADTATLLAKGASTQERKLYCGIVSPDSCSALQTFLNLCEDRTLAAEALQAVTCQRLIRTLCPSCKQAYRPDPNILRKANLPVTKDQVFYQPPAEPEVDKKGNPIICPSCQGSGYLGRTGVFELLIIDDVIREMIKGNASIKDIRDQARKNQMRYVWEEGLEKVREGTTGMNEILRVLQPADKKKASSRQPVK